MGDKKGHGPSSPATGASPDGASVSPIGADASRGEAGPEGEPGPPGEARLGLRHRIFIRLAHLWFFLTRGMTMGVRVIATDSEGRVFLVRHTYVPGWHLPGGGIEWGQDAHQAVVAELREEGGLVLGAPPELAGIYLNLSASRRDHVLLFLARGVTQPSPRAPDREIAEARFFARDALPAGTTRGTRRRLAEVFDGRPQDRIW